LIIDDHNHIWIGQATGEGWTSRPLTVDSLLSAMDRAGVDRAGICSLAQDIQNEYVLRAQREHPDRLLGYCFVNPRDKDAPETLRRYLGEGLVGLKLHPRLHGFPLNAMRLVDPLFEVCREHRVHVFAHGAGLEEFNPPHYFEDVAQAFPDVTLIMGHMGALNEVDDAIRVASRNPNIYLDTSACDLFGVQRAIAALGAERLLMGSDWPASDFRLELLKIELATEGHPGAFAQIAGGNYERLFLGNL